MSKIDFRPPGQSDTNFILSSWCESYRRSDWSGPMSDKLYFDAQRAHITELLSRPSTRVICCYATSEAPPDDLLGYIVYGPGVVYYTYVKFLFRKNGVARELLKRAGITLPCSYPFKTRAAIEYTKAHHGWKFDPRRARYDFDKV